MFEELKHCFTTGGYCPKWQDVVPECVTDGFCGGKRDQKTSIVPLHEKALKRVTVTDQGLITSLTGHGPSHGISTSLSRRIGGLTRRPIFKSMARISRSA